MRLDSGVRLIANHGTLHVRLAAMRILYVHERFGALAGAETNAQITALELGRRGHAIGILHGPETGKGRESWCEAFPDRFALSPADGPRGVAGALEKFSPDVAYVHKMSELPVIEALVRSGQPLVRMVHDHDIYCMRSYKYFYFSRRICERAAGWRCVFPCGAFLVRNRQGWLPLRWVSYRQKKREIGLNRKFDRMLVVTEYMRKELLRNGFEGRRIELHPPVPRPGDATLRSSFSDRNLILFAGQIIRGKGVDVLLRALAKVRVRFECVILGDGNHRPRCEKICRQLGIHHRVHFKGFVPQEELKAYYRECSVVAISSLWPEPIATIGLEVMRYGLPVVAFDAGGISDWLRDGVNGFLVPWKNEQRYAAQLERLLQDKELARRMGECGRSLVNERYDFEKYIAGLESMFERVIEGRKKR